MQFPMMAKRALGDITNRHNVQKNTLPYKRVALPQKSTIPKRARQAHNKLLPSAHPVSTHPLASNAKIIDIDASDKLNHVEGSDFAAEIHKNHLIAEKRHLPNSDLLRSHASGTKKMRAILVDWLADVCVSLNLSDSTLHLCVHVLDRFLQTHEPTRSTLQLVGSVCLYIAAKYEEIYAPDASDFMTLADRAFSRDDVIIMEASILNALHFEITTPYSLTFLARIGKTLVAKGVHADTTRNILKRAQMFVEEAMVDGRHLKYRPSHLAAAAVLLAMQKLNVGESWCKSLEFHSGWGESELAECMEDVRELIDGADMSTTRHLRAVRRKFARE